MLQLTIRLFGTFRQFQQDPVVLTIAPGSTVQAVKNALWAHLQTIRPGFGDPDLLNRSVLSTDELVLADTDTVQVSQTLAILPPVCGG